MVVTDDLAGVAVERIVSICPGSIALAGGSTPRLVYERLAAAPLPWAEMHLFFGDERCVAADHPAANYRMVREALLNKVETRVHRMPGESCDAGAYEAELATVFGAGLPRFDLILLGLGADGHTASLFCGDPALEERERYVVRVNRPDHARLTLTLPVLSAGQEVVFLVSGASKREALARLLAGADIPAARIDAERVMVIADRAAAGS
ncbi:MAG: 6-phosphogluconolactonase [Dehalococcoidia bacterium]